MTDDELIAAFESTGLPAEQFTHEAHVRVAWWYLRATSLPEALVRFSTALRRFAAAKGAATKYHETITVAYMQIIAARLGGARGLTWDEFAAANPDLLIRSPSPLSRLYSDALLASERARAAFVPPDRCPRAGDLDGTAGLPGPPASRTGSVGPDLTGLPPDRADEKQAGNGVSSSGTRPAVEIRTSRRAGDQGSSSNLPH